MARPSAKVIISKHIDDIDYEVLEAFDYYYITYQDKPITLRTGYYTAQGKMIKYGKTGYTNRGSAQRTADTLNHRYNTTLFVVTKI